jgi:hypothetical protein
LSVKVRQIAWSAELGRSCSRRIDSLGLGSGWDEKAVFLEKGHFVVTQARPARGLFLRSPIYSQFVRFGRARERVQTSALRVAHAGWQLIEIPMEIGAQPCEADLESVYD